MLGGLFSWVPSLPQGAGLSPSNTSSPVSPGPKDSCSIFPSTIPHLLGKLIPKWKGKPGALWEASALHPGDQETRVLGGPGEERPSWGQVSRYRRRWPQSRSPWPRPPISPSPCASQALDASFLRDSLLCPPPCVPSGYSTLSLSHSIPLRATAPPSGYSTPCTPHPSVPPAPSHPFPPP